MSWRRLKHFCEGPPQYGLNVDAGEYTDEGVRLLRTTDIQEDGALIPGKAGVFLPSDMVESRYLLREGDLLFSRAGSLGRCFRVATTTKPVTFAGYLVRFRPVQEVEPRYIEYCAATHFFQGKIEADAVTSTISNFNAERYGNLLLPDRNQAEQRTIANFLDSATTCIDALVTKKRRMIDLMRERFWHSVDSKFSALENVPRHKLTWLAHTWCDGPFGSSLTSAHYSDSGARVVRLGNVGRGEFVNLDAAFVPVEYFESLRRHEVLEGDLIVAGLGDERRPLARACVAPELGLAMVKADCFRFRLRTELVSPDFVAWYLSSPSAVAASALLSQGSTRARANLATVCGLRVPLPHQSVQQLIVESIQRERAAASDVAMRIKEQVELLQERRQALITAAVTGEVQVPGVAA